MKQYIGIKDGKIWDICYPLSNKRTKDNGEEVDTSKVMYILTNEKDLVVGDEYTNDEFVRNSPKRFEPKQKSKLEQLEDRIKTLEDLLT